MTLVSVNGSMVGVEPTPCIFSQLNYMTHSPESDLFRMLCSGYLIAPVRFFTQNGSETRRKASGLEPEFLA